jgi:phosphatidylglycerophosphatase A
VTEQAPGARAAVLVATLFGAGRAPVVPGTFGTLAAVPPAVLLSLWLPPWGFALATAILSVIAIVTSGTAARALGLKDPRPVVIDEAAGLFVTLLYLPVGPRTVALGFVLFRVMDIVKPPPARRAEGLPGGWGIVVDDLIAGVYANCALRILVALSLLRSGA